MLSRYVAPCGNDSLWPRRSWSGFDVPDPCIVIQECNRKLSPEIPLESVWWVLRCYCEWHWTIWSLPKWKSIIAKPSHCRRQKLIPTLSPVSLLQILHLISNQTLWNRDEESLFCSSGDRKRVTWVFGCSCACPVAVWSWTLKWERTVIPGSDAAVLKMHVAVRTVVHRVVLVAFEMLATLRTRGNPRCSPATNYCSLLNSGHHSPRKLSVCHLRELTTNSQLTSFTNHTVRHEESTPCLTHVL